MLKIKALDLKKSAIETLVIPVCEDKVIHTNRMISQLIRKAKGFKDFKGKKNDEFILYDFPELNIKRILFLGMGEFKEINTEVFRKMAGKACKWCIKKKLPELALAIPTSKSLIKNISSIIKASMEGLLLANYRFDKYKEKKEYQPLKNFDVLIPEKLLNKYSKLPNKVQAICQGTQYARQWVSLPPNDKRPQVFAKDIIQLGRKEDLKIHVWDENELKKGRFGSILAVAAGSNSKPRMVVMEYNPPKAAKTIVLVGKGVTFDSGGINLKPTGSLFDMKMDMAGAAAVAATLITISRLKSKIRVIGIVPIVENMLSGNATRPGDIIKSYMGKTIEIGNTDAEGRLILADAMAFAVKKYKPEILIDVATLTGACVVALGEKIAGVFSFDDELANKIVSSGEKTHERCWRLPLPKDYKRLLKSNFADINNMSSSRWGGAITAALFLSEFAGNSRWAHIDIAGPAYLQKGDDYCLAGGTGFGVRLLYDFIDQL